MFDLFYPSGPTEEQDTGGWNHKIHRLFPKAVQSTSVTKLVTMLKHSARNEDREKSHKKELERLWGLPKESVNTLRLAL